MEPIEVVHRLGRWSTGRGPLYLLLAARLRQLIDEGELPPGSVLPPDRVFARILSVGRSTVVAAYGLLEGEGRIVRRQGSGTRVAGAAPVAATNTTSAPMFLHLLEPDPELISLACAAPAAPPPEVTAAFTAMLPELASITADIGYHPAGCSILREAIAERYTRLGAPTHPDRILVTNGGQQALSLLARAFIAPGDRVLVETPTYPGALEAFREQAAVLDALPVGFAGFEAAVRARRPVLGYLTPAFQNPTGAVLSRLIRRRIAEVAAAAGVALIADEVLADLAFPDEVIPPFAVDADAAIAIGSLSKSIWGGLRIGWIRAPIPVVERVTRLRAVHDLGGNLPVQLAAARLVLQLDPLCASHAAQRQSCHDTLLGALAAQLPEWTVSAVRGGQTLWVRLPYGDGNSFAQTALRHGVAVLAGSGLDAAGGSNDYIRLHFRHPESTLIRAVTRLATAWHDYRPPAQPATTPPTLAV
ncbi:PLP-dependent aminotransferase family protein [Nocardia sp. NBC_00508]|uniref:aminotransferase-like domain-containing protein n=1 Tax=Nocardia sp. NBC_00508 TaxID=2975992 RepID=UPI002E81752A|nr:PLP-dependent aminotransferase family protein [Nocardia sp. NBC_00508]WUD66327.1 PLP-dependent aminotransferase family protein [Nocardia sp. NBC_00508]